MRHNKEMPLGNNSDISWTGIIGTLIEHGAHLGLVTYTQTVADALKGPRPYSYDVDSSEPPLFPGHLQVSSYINAITEKYAIGNRKPRNHPARDTRSMRGYLMRTEASYREEVTLECVIGAAALTVNPEMGVTSEILAEQITFTLLHPEVKVRVLEADRFIFDYGTGLHIVGGDRNDPSTRTVFSDAPSSTRMVLPEEADLYVTQWERAIVDAHTVEDSRALMQGALDNL